MEKIHGLPRKSDARIAFKKMQETQIRKSLHRKIFAFAVLISFFAVNSYSQIRSHVGIVRGQFSQDFINQMEVCREKIRGSGYTSYAKVIDSYLAGGFGSGFVYVADDGKTYVLTNRHVIMEADTASIEFENSDGNSETYNDLAVVAMSEDIDLAILAFPPNNGGGYGTESLKRGLQFSSAAVKDGQEVWSAGFPGLGSEPVWQLGKGVVTNASARIKELIDPSVSVVIQHSAEIDRGNSGGPLLVSSKKNVGYEVVGINTWKAAYRQNTNFAVPASAILAFIKNFRQKTAATEEKDVRDCAEQFISILNDGESDFISLVKMISVKMALDTGTQDFIDVLKFAPSSERSRIAAEFEQFPVEGFRCASAYQMWAKHRPKENEEAFKIVSSEKDSDKYKFSLASGDGSKSVKLLWTKENGSWKIASVSFNENPVEKNKEKENAKEKSKEKSKSKSSSPRFEAPTRFDFSAGLLICVPEKDLGFHINFDLWHFSYAGFGFMFEHFPFEDKSINVGGVGFIARLPFNISEKMNLGCVGRIGADAGRYNGWGVLGFFVEAGIEFLYLGNKAKPGLGVSFKYSRQNQFGDIGYDEKSLHEGFKTLKVYAKIAF